MKGAVRMSESKTETETREIEEIEPRDIESAPHNRPVFVFCAPHWYDDVRWSETNMAGTGLPGWYRDGWRRVKPTLWYPRDLGYEALLAEVRAGKQPAVRS